MDIYQLKHYLIESVPNFSNPEVIDTEGEYFHYTPHWELIKSDGQFKGALINENLDCTQDAIVSKPAVEKLGVVFAYENFKNAKEEGFGCDIVKIRSSKAIRTMQSQENLLGELTKKILQDSFNDDNTKVSTPPTILILTSDIIDFNLA